MTNVIPAKTVEQFRDLREQYKHWETLDKARQINLLCQVIEFLSWVETEWDSDGLFVDMCKEADQRWPELKDKRHIGAWAFFMQIAMDNKDESEIEKIQFARCVLGC